MYWNNESRKKGCEIMKQILVLCLMLAMILTAAGCKKNISDPNVEPGTPEATHGDPIDNAESESFTPIDFGVHYIRTDGYHDGAKFPMVEIIQSRESLDAYYTEHCDIYDLGPRDDVYPETSVSFLDACNGYNDEYFQDQYLVLVLLEEGSGSVSHAVEKVGLDDTGKMRVDIHREVPEVGTADMAEWHIILELSREDLVDSRDAVLIRTDGSLVFDGAPVETPYWEPETIFQSPPNGYVDTPDGKYKLAKGGCTWTHRKSDGEYITICADQAGRPLEQRFMETVTISSKYLETVYAPIPGSTAYEPTNALGALLKLDFEAMPASVTFTCWPDTVWTDSDAQEEAVISHEGFSFYAHHGGYVYEIVAEWDEGSYYGTALYYVHVIAG